MELKDFIKTALVDIITGVDEAKNELGKKRVLLCPPVPPLQRKELGAKIDINGRFHQSIEFDVAVTAMEEVDKTGNIDAKIGIKVFGGAAGISETTNISNSTISRIKFHVPIALEAD